MTQLSMPRNVGLTFLFLIRNIRNSQFVTGASRRRCHRSHIVRAFSAVSA